MSKFQILLTTLVISLIINATAINYSLKFKNEKKAAELKADNMESLVHSVKSEYDSKIKTINKEYKNKIDDLNKKINEFDQTVVIYQNSTNMLNGSENNNPDGLTWLERLKNDNPEEYDRITTDRRNRYNDLKYTLAERTQIFLNMDTSYMNGDEQENHKQLVDRMGKIFELSQLFKDPADDSSRESNREIWREIGPIMQEVRPMLEIERKAIFKNTFSEKFGLDSDESSEFADYIEHLIDATTFQPNRRRNITNN